LLEQYAAFGIAELLRLIDYEDAHRSKSLGGGPIVGV
jgi:hypothetical protein